MILDICKITLTNRFQIPGFILFENIKSKKLNFLFTSGFPRELDLFLIANYQNAIKVW